MRNEVMIHSKDIVYNASPSITHYSPLKSSHATYAAYSPPKTDPVAMKYHDFTSDRDFDTSSF